MSPAATAPRSAPPLLRDPFGRVIEYLRVSITDRCNFRCVYCMPATGGLFAPRNSLLAPCEIETILASARKLGVKRIRLTGGEPLTRPDAVEIVERIARLGFEDVSLSTNGQLLAPLARALKKAGLRRVNISMDSLRPERFREITRLGDLERVWEGIASAEAAGLAPIKLNMVAAKGVNDDEIADFAALSKTRPLHVRFIELMPIGDTGFFKPEHWMKLDAIRAACGPLEPAEAPEGAGPAVSFRLRGAVGTIGFISALSCNFCKACNRMRLTSTGRLMPCLGSPLGVELAPVLGRADAGRRLEALLREAASIKPERHHMEEASVREHFMCSLGG